MRQISISRAKTADSGGMNRIFICPRTNLKVQHRTDRTSARDHEYEVVTCPACLRLHFINCTTGRLLGHEAPKAGDPLSHLSWERA